MFIRASNDAWSQTVYLKASNSDTGDAFVTAPAEESAATGINGNEADNSLGSAGAAYVGIPSPID